MMRNYNGSNNGTLYIYIYLLINPFHHRRFERIRQKISETWNKTRGDFPPATLRSRNAINLFHRHWAGNRHEQWAFVYREDRKN